MNKEREQALAKMIESAAKLPESECTLLAGIAKGMEISAGIQAQQPQTASTRTA